MKNYKLGIIGHGYVGESQSFAFSPSFDVRVYDKDSLKSTHSLNEVLDSDFIFVCVPTPMKKDGSQDLSFVESFFKTAKDGEQNCVSNFLHCIDFVGKRRMQIVYFHHIKVVCRRSKSDSV